MSFVWLLSLVGKDKFELFLSVPLVLEYESVAKRQSRQIGLTHSDIDDVLDYLCHIGVHRQIHYLWRPYLRFGPSPNSIYKQAGWK